jgi:hypothetical protein
MNQFSKISKMSILEFIFYCVIFLYVVYQIGYAVGQFVGYMENNAIK